MNLFNQIFAGFKRALSDIVWKLLWKNIMQQLHFDALTLYNVDSGI